VHHEPCFCFFLRSDRKNNAPNNTVPNELATTTILGCKKVKNGSLVSFVDDELPQLLAKIASTIREAKKKIKKVSVLVRSFAILLPSISITF
jgi:hypothetical protein